MTDLLSDTGIQNSITDDAKLLLREYVPGNRIIIICFMKTEVC